MSASGSWDPNIHATQFTSPMSVVLQCELVSGWGLRKQKLLLFSRPCCLGRIQVLFCFLLQVPKSQTFGNSCSREVLAMQTIAFCNILITFFIRNMEIWWWNINCLWLLADARPWMTFMVTDNQYGRPHPSDSCASCYICVLCNVCSADARNRPDCYWGRHCRTQRCKQHHARFHQTPLFTCSVQFSLVKACTGRRNWTDTVTFF